MTKIDDEMVTRAYAKACAIGQSLTLDEDGVRAILEAAVSPKPEPEIEVTEGMMRAGADAGWNQYHCDRFDRVASIYRAMLKAAPEGAKPAPQGVNAAAPVKETGGGVRFTHRRQGDPGWDTPFGVGSVRRAHRRKDDPK